MQVAPGNIVRFHYTLRSEDGGIIDSSIGASPLSYLHGHQRLNVAGLEDKLAGHNPGEEVVLELPPAQAFGEHDPQKVQTLPRELFPSTATLTEGERYKTVTTDGKELSFHIVEVRPEEIIIDLNPPFAGQFAILAVQIEEVRQATPEEVQKGRPL